MLKIESTTLKNPNLMTFVSSKKFRSKNSDGYIRIKRRRP